MSNRLITIPASHFCEKTRWALQLANIDFVEEGHITQLHRRPVKRVGGKGTVPVLVTKEGIFDGSDEIMLWIATQSKGSLNLFPIESTQKAEVAKWMKLFDDELGVATRLVSYSWLFQNQKLLKRIGKHGIPTWQRMILPLLAPLASRVRGKKLNLTPELVDSSIKTITSILNTVSDHLDAGNSFLVGDQLTIADTSLAALAGLVTIPEGYGTPQARMEELPAAVPDQIDIWRQTTAGEFIQRIYRDYRRL